MTSELKFIYVDNSNIDALKFFLIALGTGKKYFRYFENRNLDVMSNHIVTLLLMNDLMPVAYGHLDEENGKVWLGTATAENMQGNGYGKMMIKRLLSEAQKKNIDTIHLTVDHENVKAQSLYKKFGFVFSEKKEIYSIYTLQLK